MKFLIGRWINFLLLIIDILGIVVEFGIGVLGGFVNEFLVSMSL